MKTATKPNPNPKGQKNLVDETDSDVRTQQMAKRVNAEINAKAKKK